MVYDRKAQILTLIKTSDTEWQWLSSTSAWLRIEPQNKINLFSKLGIGVTSVLFSLHPRQISLHQALRLGGRHYFLTFISKSTVKMEVTAAEVVPRRCEAIRMDTGKNERKNPIHEPRTVSIFPAVLVEKYQGFRQEEPMAQTELTLVLVTPKPIKLRVGDIISVEGEGTFSVQLCHTMAPYQNEYEVYRKEDA